MSAVIRQWCLLLVVASGLLVGCSSERDRQWYKPNVNYTVDEFKRDRDALHQQGQRPRRGVHEGARLGAAHRRPRRRRPSRRRTNPRGPKLLASARSSSTSAASCGTCAGTWPGSSTAPTPCRAPRSSRPSTARRRGPRSSAESAIPVAWTDGAHRELERRAGRTLPRLHDEWRKAQAPIEPNVDLVRALRPPYRCSILSNADVSLRGRLEGELALHHLFDDIVVSAEVGMAKPTPAIFRLAAERLGLPPAACVFVDDWDKNVEAAREVGMHGGPSPLRPGRRPARAARRRRRDGGEPRRVARTALFLSPGAELAPAVALARRADALGYESLWVTHGIGRDALQVLAAYGARGPARRARQRASSRSTRGIRCCSPRRRSRCPT